MGQHCSKSAASLNAHSKSEGRNSKELRKIKSVNNKRRSFRNTPSEAIDIPVGQTNRLTTTINLHIEDNGSLSTSSLTTKGEFEPICNNQHCQCASNSPRQLIIKIQLSKMEQTNEDTSVTVAENVENTQTITRSTNNCRNTSSSSGSSSSFRCKNISNTYSSPATTTAIMAGV